MCVLWKKEASIFPTILAKIAIFLLYFGATVLLCSCDVDNSGSSNDLAGFDSATSDFPQILDSSPLGDSGGPSFPSTDSQIGYITVQDDGGGPRIEEGGKGTDVWAMPIDSAMDRSSADSGSASESSQAIAVQLFFGTVDRTISVIAKTLEERIDPAMIFCGEIRVDLI